MAEEPKNPYDFITNPPQPPKKPMFSFGAGENSKLKRAILFGVLFIILITAFIVILSFFNKASNAQSERLMDVAEAQTEIIRVSDLAVDKISDKNLLYKTVNVQITVSSSKNEVLDALSKRGKKIKDKDLQANKDLDNDEALTKGEQNGRFDAAYEELLKSQLANYQSLLEAAHADGSKTEKQILESANSQINLLNGKTASQ